MARSRWITKVTLDARTGCWVWRGARVKERGGHYYGKCGRVVDGVRRTLLVHRVMYEFVHGPIPAGLVVHHRCLNRLCVNPAHLAAVTHRENVQIRRQSPGRWKSRCKRGHLLSDRNIYWQVRHGQIRGRGYRRCRTLLARER